MNNNDFFEDEDESFDNDINFNPLIADTKPTNTKNILINGNQNKLNDIPTTNMYQTNQSSEINIIKGRTLSPAILAKTIQANRSIPLPGSSKRPPHLRLNNN